MFSETIVGACENRFSIFMSPRERGGGGEEGRSCKQETCFQSENRELAQTSKSSVKKFICYHLGNPILYYNSDNISQM